MDPNKTVTGEENIYFEMESTAEADGYDDVVETYDEVAQATAGERPLPVPKQTSFEKCMHKADNDRHALAELENICRSNTVIIRRMWSILSATVAVLLTAVATLILVTLMILKSRDCAVTTTTAATTTTTATQGKFQNLFIPRSVHVRIRKN